MEARRYRCMTITLSGEARSSLIQKKVEVDDATSRNRPLDFLSQVGLPMGVRASFSIWGKC